MKIEELCVCVCDCVSLFISRPLVFPSRECRARTLIYECKIDQTDFTDCMSFLPSHLLEDIQKP